MKSPLLDNNSWECLLGSDLNFFVSITCDLLLQVDEDTSMVWLDQLLDFRISRGGSGKSQPLPWSLSGLVWMLWAEPSSKECHGIVVTLLKNSCVCETVKRLGRLQPEMTVSVLLLRPIVFKWGLLIDEWLSAEKSPPRSDFLGWTSFSNFITYILTYMWAFPQQ